ncbi:hypothetical protein ACFE04_007147 [Oxalis oulophora]
MASTSTVTIPPVARQRPIVRLGIFLISHSLIVSVLCCISAIISLLLLPVLAKNTYISENALLPGSASSMISTHDVSIATRLMQDIRNSDPGIESQTLIGRYMSDLAAEVSYHRFPPQLNNFHPLHFFSSSPSSEVAAENFSSNSYGVNTVGIIRAPRGDGKESIVLVTPYSYLNKSPGEALSLAIAYSVFSLLSRVTWLGKDVIWLVADSRYDDYSPVAAWLREYYTPVFSGGNDTPDEFRRGGTMAAALVLKVADDNRPFEDTLNVYAEASNGQMPNLDLINVLVYLAVHRHGLHVKIEKLWSLLESKCVKFLGEVFELLGNVARSLNPQWKFGITASDYVDGAATLASSLYYQASGIPTGPHGAFRDYQVDAITLEISPKFSSNHLAKQKEFILRGGSLVYQKSYGQSIVLHNLNHKSYGQSIVLHNLNHKSYGQSIVLRHLNHKSYGQSIVLHHLSHKSYGQVIEGTIRSVNNLLEKFHQSFFLYLLTSPSKFVSVGVYMVAFALLIAPLPMVAASLYANAINLDPQSCSNLDNSSIMLKSWKWLHAAKKVFVVHLWGLIVSLLPYFISQIQNSTPKTSFVIWIFLSVLTFLVLQVVLVSPIHQELKNQEWAILKSVTISATFIGLCLMSIINFASAEIGALFVVPLCLLCYPLNSDIKSKNLRNFARVFFNLVFVFLAFPPAAFFVLKGVFSGFGDIDVADFWKWLESLWMWNSATYLYMGMVHLPCWILCVHILLHRC